LLFTLFFGLLVDVTATADAATAPEEPIADRDAVHAAVLDYVEGLYENDPSRIERSVHPELTKRGWKRDRRGVYREHPLTFERLVDGAERFDTTGWIPDDAPKEIVIFDVLDRVASAKLTAVWGIDYLHLAKFDGRWQILHVIWQGHPSD
ncbi:MAG: nuclear transport factor 2 family protein, partial [Acidobacteriota bacterium]